MFSMCCEYFDGKCVMHYVVNTL